MLADCNNQNQQLLILDLINKTGTCVSEFDLVAFLDAMEAYRRNLRLCRHSASLDLNWSRVTLSSLRHSFRASSQKASSKVIQRNLVDGLTFPRVGDGVQLKILKPVQ